ncbi:uncharacterized protein LOC134674129 [Cydia fagiglandana]|uniref:uncharacterized protein LOC134674129 n=1 Tax=Cydia fagiglandana TaxID=1458189 RepID=UPI002FEE3A92
MSLETAHIKEAEAVCVKTGPGEVCVKTEPGEVCVKTEPGEVCVKTEPGEVCVKTEPGEVCVKTEPEEPCVKEEQECEDSVLRGVSALHTDHEVKYELVLGPEEWHRPKASQDDMLRLNMAAGDGASDEGEPMLFKDLLIKPEWNEDETSDEMSLEVHLVDAASDEDCVSVEVHLVDAASDEDCVSGEYCDTTILRHRPPHVRERAWAIVTTLAHCGLETSYKYTYEFLR